MTAPRPSGGRRPGCRDWHATHTATPDGAREMVAVPADALEEGLARFVAGGGMTRRQLLERGVGLWVAASVVGAGLSSRRVLEAAAAQEAASPDAPILVTLYLDGGNDGLNTLVPLADPEYRRLRSRVAIAPEQTLPLADTADFGWHPSLERLRTLYDQGKVAVLPSVDFADADQSHFNSAAYWRRGIVGPTRETAGWLGRAMDVAGSTDNPLQAIGVSWSPDPLLASHRAPTATVYDPGDVGFWMEGVWDHGAFPRAYGEASTASAGGSPALQAARAAYRNAFTVAHKLAPLRVDDENPAPPVPVEYPSSHLGNGLRNLARMLGAGFGTRVATLSMGGYDTHDDQPGAHADLLRDLSESMWAWQADLEAKGLARRVLTLIWSEFGRRPEDNESAGTDHGAGGLLLLVGDRANGGIRSEFPGLHRLDEDDNLLVTTEFRTVYASLLEQWIGVEAGRVLPGIDTARIPLVR